MAILKQEPFADFFNDLDFEKELDAAMDSVFGLKPEEEAEPEPVQATAPIINREEFLLTQRPELQFLVYTLAAGFFSLAPVYKKDGEFYSLEAAPQMMRHRTDDLGEILAEIALYCSIFDDFDHGPYDYRNVIFDLSRDGVYHPENGNLMIIRDNEGYAYQLYDFGEAAIFDGKPRRMPNRLSIINLSLHHKMLVILQRMLTNYDCQQGLSYTENATFGLRLDGCVRSSIYRKFRARLTSLESHLRFKLNV